jgi:hypothetical protein
VFRLIPFRYPEGRADSVLGAEVWRTSRRFTCDRSEKQGRPLDNQLHQHALDDTGHAVDDVRSKSGGTDARGRSATNP